MDTKIFFQCTMSRCAEQYLVLFVVIRFMMRWLKRGYSPFSACAGFVTCVKDFDMLFMLITLLQVACAFMRQWPWQEYVVLESKLGTATTFSITIFWNDSKIERISRSQPLQTRVFSSDSMLSRNIYTTHISSWYAFTLASLLPFKINIIEFKNSSTSLYQYFPLPLDPNCLDRAVYILNHIYICAYIFTFILNLLLNML